VKERKKNKGELLTWIWDKNMMKSVHMKYFKINRNV